MDVMKMTHQNDPDLIRNLLVDAGMWVVVGLSDNRSRDAWHISRFLKMEHGKGIIPVHPSAATVHGETGYALSR